MKITNFQPDAIALHPKHNLELPILAIKPDSHVIISKSNLSAYKLALDAFENMVSISEETPEELEAYALVGGADMINLSQMYSKGGKDYATIQTNVVTHDDDPSLQWECDATGHRKPKLNHWEA